MSKASEWAKKLGSRPEINLRRSGKLADVGTTNSAHVAPGGSCRISNGYDVIFLGPEEAIELARWIFDTFAEERT